MLYILYTCHVYELYIVISRDHISDDEGSQGADLMSVGTLLLISPSLCSQHIIVLYLLFGLVIDPNILSHFQYLWSELTLSDQAMFSPCL